MTSPAIPSVTIDDVRAAAKAIDGHVERTAFSHSRTLSHITGAEVWIKFENRQFTASFKERGALNKLLGLSEPERRAGVVAMSAGNHAQGVAYHAARLGVAATIVMPIGTPFVKVENTRVHGARVVLQGTSLAEADAYARKLEADGLTFIHPYDDPLVIAGQGVTAVEMLEDRDDLDIIVVPVGGGGLISGVAVAAHAHPSPVSVVGVQSRMYPALRDHLQGSTMQRSGGSTIAEGIAVEEIGVLPKRICAKLVSEVLLVDEDALERAITLLMTVEKTVAEGAGAAGLAALLAHPGRFQGRRIGLILCGGNIDTRLLASVLTRSLVREKRLVSIRVVGDDTPGLLAQVSIVIGASGANIVEVAHNRMQLDVPAKGAEFDITIETRDAQHTRDVIEALEAAGFPPR